MPSSLIVVFYKLRALLVQMSAVSTWCQVQFIIFYGSKEPFNMRIICGSTFSIHGYLSLFWKKR